jgi:hypothetical protein
VKTVVQEGKGRNRLLVSAIWGRPAMVLAQISCRLLTQGVNNLLDDAVGARGRAAHDGAVAAGGRATHNGAVGTRGRAAHNNAVAARGWAAHDGAVRSWSWALHFDRVGWLGLVMSVLVVMIECSGG